MRTFLAAGGAAEACALAGSGRPTWRAPFGGRVGGLDRMLAGVH